MERRLKINLADLEFAFSDSEMTSYLDLETGEVISATDEIQSAVEAVTEEAEASGVEFAEALTHSALPDWMKDAVNAVADLEDRLGTTAIVVEADEPSLAFRDMASFSETVRNPRVRSELNAALAGNRPFRRFKDVLLNCPDEEQRWFEFRDAGVRTRMFDWLEDEGIELEAEDDAPPDA